MQSWATWAPTISRLLSPILVQRAFVQGPVDRAVFANRVVRADHRRGPAARACAVCCGKPPSTAPSKIVLFDRPGSVPLLITTRLASVQLSPIDDVGLDDGEGTDRDVATELGLRADEGLWMDVHRRILRGGVGPDYHGGRCPRAGPSRGHGEAKRFERATGVGRRECSLTLRYRFFRWCQFNPKCRF